MSWRLQPKSVFTIVRALDGASPRQPRLAWRTRSRTFTRCSAMRGVAGPYIMVGHSYGGALVRLFAKNYPSQVAGVVLVGSAFYRPGDVRFAGPDQVKHGLFV